MNHLLIARLCFFVGLGLNAMFLTSSDWMKCLISTVDWSNQVNSTSLLLEDGIHHSHSAVETNQLISLYKKTQSADGGLGNTTSIKGNFTIFVDLTGEFGNQLNHIAHGRVIQNILWNEHQIPTTMVLRRYSNEEKYKRTQRQLTRCFKNLRNLEFHGPQSTSITSQKTLDRIQEEWLGTQRSQNLLLPRGASLQDTQGSVEELVSILKGDEGAQLLTNLHNYTSSLTTALVGDTSFPFIHTNAMINREMMDKFYDDFRDFFEFDEDACCITEDLPHKNTAVFHYRNFVGELKHGEKSGLEELSPYKVAKEVFGKSPRNRVAIATRFRGRKSSKEYYSELQKHGYKVRWATRSLDEQSNGYPPSAMQDFCAMRNTKELVGMVRSTFVVWAALLGNSDGIARLYSVDSTWTRKKFSQSGRPIFRSYNWTHPELQRRVHFELYQAEDQETTKS